MSLERINDIIERVKKEQYAWNPVKRKYIPKSDGKWRPLGIPSGDDKLLQAAMKLLLEAYYEPTFSKRSHGFRPGKGCHTALKEIAVYHAGVTWFIEGDIEGCFDNIDHETLLEIMEEKIEDGRINSLTRKLLKAGYMENWQKFRTYSGTPQGGIISPLLANIYLDELDKWVERELMPKYNRSPLKGGGRRGNPEYKKLTAQRAIASKKGDLETYKRLGVERNKTPSKRTEDEEYRKLEYVRYADDFLLSFAGPKAEAKEIKREIQEFLQDRLKLKLSEEKTLITHARTERAKFLGYELGAMVSRGGRRSINGNIEFRIPKEVINRAVRKYSKKGKPIHRPALLPESDLGIIWTFQTEYKGLVEYYKMANNLHAMSKVRWITETSLLKTLASKHKTTVKRTVKKYRNHKEVNGKKYKVLECRVEREGKKTLTATFGAVSLARDPMPSKIIDKRQEIVRPPNGNDLVKRLYADKCEMCGEEEMSMEVHHIRKLKDIQKPGRRKKEYWEKRMIALKRKTLVVCKECHKAIHRGEHRKAWDSWKTELESRVP